MRKTIIVPLALSLAVGLAPIPSWSEVSHDEQQVLDAIRTGKLKVTDELIDAQRALHPEFGNLTNQEIKEKLEGRIKGSPLPEGGAEPAWPTQAPRLDSKSVAKKIPPAESSTRFPEGLARFGYDFFSSNSVGSSSTGAAPALPEYVLSPGDEIMIYTWAATIRI